MNYLHLITPINIEEEKEKFFSQTNYSPRFKYKWNNIDRRRLSDRDNELLEVLLTQDSKKITNCGEAYFQVEFNNQDIDYAKAAANDIPTQIIVTANDYADIAIKKFKEFGIDYKVEIVDKHGFQGRPDHKHKILRLSKYLRTEFYSAEGLVKHELVHIIRSINGEYNKIEVQPDYLATDEGLACFVQDNVFKSQTPSLFMHSVEYLAAYVTKENGFLDVYDFLLSKGSSPESAWLRGIRQKFGLCDTSQPGGLMKSAMQYCYELKMRGLDQDDLLKLFVGKVRLDQINGIKEYTGFISKDKINSLLN